MSKLSVYRETDEELDYFSEEDDSSRPTSKDSRDSSSKRSNGLFPKLKTARSFSFFKKKSSSRDALEDVEEVDSESEDTLGEMDERWAKKADKRTKVRLTAEERRSLNRKSANKLGLTLEGELVKAPNKKKRLSFRRRSDYF